MFIFTIVFVTKSLYSMMSAYLMIFRFSENMQGHLLGLLKEPTECFLNIFLYFYIISRRTCPESNFWTIAVWT